MVFITLWGRFFWIPLADVSDGMGKRYERMEYHTDDSGYCDFWSAYMGVSASAADRRDHYSYGGRKNSKRDHR